MPYYVSIRAYNSTIQEFYMLQLYGCIQCTQYKMVDEVQGGKYEDTSKLQVWAMESGDTENQSTQ